MHHACIRLTRALESNGNGDHENYMCLGGLTFFLQPQMETDWAEKGMVRSPVRIVEKFFPCFIRSFFVILSFLLLSATIIFFFF
jgi:hypothetical protein